MTHKENKLIEEVGWEKYPLFSFNVHGTSAPLKESSDNKVISGDEPQSLIALFEATKDPFKFTDDTSQKSLTMKINDAISTEWEHGLGEGLPGNTCLKSLTLGVYDEMGLTLIGRGRNASLKLHTLKIGSCCDLGEGLARNTSLESLKIEIIKF